jgi:bacterial/archaeal transporter family protein
VLAWFVPALIATAVWGFWGLFPKIAAKTLSPLNVIVFQAIGNLGVALAVLAWLRFQPTFEPRGVKFAVLSGVAGTLGSIFYIMAASRGRISVVVALTALYPVVTILLAALWLQEPISLKDGIGMGVAIAAILILSI